MAAKSQTVEDVDVVVVGAGFAGMYLLVRLRAAGMTAVAVEAGDGVGGTWYWNRYPGARCDVESLQYSYQFDDDLQQEWSWSERFSAQPEILEYANHVADRHDLRRNIRFNWRVKSAAYAEDSATWLLTAEDGRRVRGRFCVMATGCLSVPNWPDIDGIDDFSGPTFHTALWPHDKVDFTGKRVAVIGTGSSAVQSLPHIAGEADQVTVFQRTANYSIPAHNGPLDKDREAMFKADYPGFRARAKQTVTGIHAEYGQTALATSDPDAYRAMLEKRWQEGGLTFLADFNDVLLDSAANERAAEFVRDKIRAVVKDPATAEILCPKNIIGGKRLCLDTRYFETYNRDNVRLIDIKATPIERVTETGVMVDGTLHEVDMLVVATGFDAMTGALRNIDIRGVGAASLADRWADGPSSYLGLAMADFPNLFTVTGPGSPSVLTNMLPTIEQHVEWITDCIGYMSARNYTRIEATQAAEQDWWDHVQDAAQVGLKATTDSWYVGANITGKKRVFMPYLGGFPAYCQKCADVAGADYAGFAFA